MKKKIKNFVKKVPGVSFLIRRRNQLLKVRTKKEEERRKQEQIEKRKTVAERVFNRICNKGQKEELEGLLKNQKKPLVSIIILNRNGLGRLRSLMESFHMAVFYSNFEVVFIDNASEDGSAAYMESWKQEFDITIVSNEENLSFSAANNQGAAIAKGEYLLFLNDNTTVTDYWLDELLIAACKMEHPGAFGARLIYPEALEDAEKRGKAYSIQHAGISFQDGMRKKEYMIRPYNMHQGECMDEEETAPVRKIGVTAAVLMVNRDAYDAVNGFSEEYFYGLEDVDFCLKLHQKGYYNYYCPDSIVYHCEYGTRDKNKTPEAKKRGEHNAAVFRGKWQRYLAEAIAMDQIQNTRLFTEKPLTIAVIESREAKALKPADACKESDCMEALRSFGYHVYAVKDEEKRYMLDIKTDVVLVFDSDYDITKLQCAKHDIVKAVWSCKEDGNGYFADGRYDIVISSEMQREPDATMKDFVDMLQEVYQTEIDEKSIDICGAMPDNETNRFWGDYHYAEALKREFEQRGWRARVLPREKWYDRTNARYVLVLRGVRPYYPSRETGRYFIMWNISHPADVTLAEYNLFDYVYFASKKMQEMLADKIKIPSGVLLQCTDTEVMSCNESAGYQYELLFVGNSRHVFRQILKDLLPTKHMLSVYGRHWEEFPVSDYVKGDYMDNDKVGQAYHDAKILLNDHWDDMREYGIISNRIFDALSVGAFVISDAVPGMDEVLQGAVVTYEGRADLLEKIDYYLEHEDERRQKAVRGQEIVRSQHTFACRVQQILEDIEKCKDVHTGRDILV